MSASHNGSGSDPSQTTMVPQFQQLTPLGTTGGNWLAELKSLGYMPMGQTSWGNIGQTVQTPQVVAPSITGQDQNVGIAVPNGPTPVDAWLARNKR